MFNLFGKRKPRITIHRMTREQFEKIDSIFHTIGNEMDQFFTELDKILRKEEKPRDLAVGDLVTCSNVVFYYRIVKIFIHNDKPHVTIVPVGFRKGRADAVLKISFGLSYTVLADSLTRYNGE